MRRQASASSRNERDGNVFARSWMNLAPPSRKARATSSARRCDRSAASTSTIAWSGVETLGGIGKPGRLGSQRETLHEGSAEPSGNEIRLADDLQLQGHARLDPFNHRHL